MTRRIGPCGMTRMRQPWSMWPCISCKACITSWHWICSAPTRSLGWRNRRPSCPCSDPPEQLGCSRRPITTPWRNCNHQNRPRPSRTRMATTTSIRRVVVIEQQPPGCGNHPPTCGRLLGNWNTWSKPRSSPNSSNNTTKPHRKETKTEERHNPWNGIEPRRIGPCGMPPRSLVREMIRPRRRIPSTCNPSHHPAAAVGAVHRRRRGVFPPGRVACQPRGPIGWD